MDECAIHCLLGPLAALTTASAPVSSRAGAPKVGESSKSKASKAKASAPTELHQDSQAEDSTSWIITQGEDLIHEARALEERGNIEQAVGVYRQGMTLILQGVSELGAEHPLRVSLLRKMTTCVAHAEDLKAQLLKAPVGD